MFVSDYNMGWECLRIVRFRLDSLFPRLSTWTGLCQYSAEKLLRLRSYMFEPQPAELLLQPDVTFLPRRKYTHCGSCRSFYSDTSKRITPFWSTAQRTSRNSGRVVDHSVLASLARSANNSYKCDNIPVNFGLLNIHSLMTKGHLIQDLLIDLKLDLPCLTKMWQQPNGFSQRNESTPLGLVYICQTRDSGHGGGLAIIYCDKWKVLSMAVPVYNSFETTFWTYSDHYCCCLPAPI